MELLAPGGSFASALHAFRAGADGVYLGMSEFSARAAAANFSFEQLRRVRALAGEQGRRIYVAVNTVVRDGELGRLADGLFRLDALGVDGVIVQDLGVLEVLTRFFPRLPVHASTQMAVHTPGGIQTVKRLGVRRVILPRELPLGRVRELARLHPEMELEVFIHGALCYSFSGICLASHALTGRSGNRGECAQVCRSLFTTEGKDGGQGYFFSCRDLFMGKDVLELARAGVAALKIEGRMKAPEYVFHAVRLYREILDRGEELPTRELELLVRNTELTFARRRTGGYTRSPHGTDLIDRQYPGHRGALLGTVTAVRGAEMTIRLSGDLSLHDGAAWWPPAGPPGAEPVIFSVQGITAGGREVRFARSGETVGIRLPPSAVPEPGQEIRHLSSRFLDLPQVKEASVRPWRIPLDLAVELSADEGGRFAVRAAGAPFGAEDVVPGGSGAGSGRPGGPAEGAPIFSAPAAFQPASRRRPFREVLQPLLSESGQSLFTLGRLTLVNRTGLPDDGIFLPPALLKALKNELYRTLDERFEEMAGRCARAVSAPVSPAAVPAPPAVDAGVFADRSRLWPGPVPFASLGAGGRPAGSRLTGRLAGEPVVIQGMRVVPLPPVMADEAAWLPALEAELTARPGENLAVGLSNVGQLEIARRLAANERVWFFVDFTLYAANRHTVSLLLREVPRVLFMYHWIEGGDGELPSLREGVGESPPPGGPPRPLHVPLDRGRGRGAPEPAGGGGGQPFPRRRGRGPAAAGGSLLPAAAVLQHGVLRTARPKRRSLLRRVPARVQRGPPPGPKSLPRRGARLRDVPVPPRPVKGGSGCRD
jgi:U32 family peptidase